MSYADAETFMVDESTFPADTMACGYRLQAHSILVDLMLGELAPFAVAYRQCVMDLHSSEHKFGRNPPLPDFPGLLRHVHTKTLDGFLGRLLASWLERVHPDGLTPPAQAATSPIGPGTSTSRASGTPEGVTNTNYMNSLKKRWQASGLGTLQLMLQAHAGEGPPSVPKMGEQEACLLWLIKGWCFTNCPRVSTHKQANQALIAQVHALMDTCGLLTSS
jgi:hypothetical protein